MYVTFIRIHHFIILELQKCIFYLFLFRKKHIYPFFFLFFLLGGAQRLHLIVTAIEHGYMEVKVQSHFPQEV